MWFGSVLVSMHIGEVAWWACRNAGVAVSYPLSRLSAYCVCLEHVHLTGGVATYNVCVCASTVWCGVSVNQLVNMAIMYTIITCTVVE